MGFFDFETPEREERGTNIIQGRGDSVRELMDHRWMSFVIVMLLIAIGARIPELLAMVAFMLIILLIAWLWSRRSLRSLVYHRRFPYRRFFPDETVDVEIVVENRKLLPVSWLQIEDQWPMHVSVTDEKRMARTEHNPDHAYLINTYALRWYERIRRRFTFTTQARGVYEIGPAHLLSGDPFSLFDRKVEIINRYEVLIVYPRIRTLPEIGLPLKDPFGDKRVQRRLFEDPSRTMGVRDYTSRDSFRSIHWKASARNGTLQTRVYEPTRSLRTVLCLNVATFEQHWRGVWPEMLEYEMEIAASLAAWATEEKHSIGMVANGTLAHSDQPFRIPPSQRPDQLPLILQSLAAVSYFVSTSFDRFLIEESPRLPWGATLILITPFINPAITGTILRLRDSGRRVALIALGKQAPPHIDRIISYHLPIQEDEPELPPLDDDSDPSELPDDLTPRQRYLMRRAREEANQRAAESPNRSRAR